MGSNQQPPTTVHPPTYTHKWELRSLKQDETKVGLEWTDHCSTKSWRGWKSELYSYLGEERSRQSEEPGRKPWDSDIVKGCFSRSKEHIKWGVEAGQGHVVAVMVGHNKRFGFNPEWNGSHRWVLWTRMSWYGLCLQKIGWLVRRMSISLEPPPRYQPYPLIQLRVGNPYSDQYICVASFWVHIEVTLLCLVSIAHYFAVRLAHGMAYVSNSFFSLMSCIPLYDYGTIYSLYCRWIFVSNIRLLWMKLLWTYLYTASGKHMHSFILSLYLEMELLCGGLGEPV